MKIPCASRGGGEDEEGEGGDGDGDAMEEDEGGDMAVILHEDKKYYPDAEDVYPEAQTMVQEEDSQPLDKPIIAPIRTKNFDHVEKKTPVTPYSTQYLHDVSRCPTSTRNPRCYAPCLTLALALGFRVASRGFLFTHLVLPALAPRALQGITASCWPKP